jgi:hypothetical protein
MNEPIKAHAVSDPYLFNGFTQRSVLLAHDGAEPLVFTLEVDRLGNNQWQKLRDITVPPHSSTWSAFRPEEKGEWVRVSANRDSSKATVLFFSSNQESRTTKPDAIFDGLASANASDYSAALLRSGGDDVPTLAVAATLVSGDESAAEALYHMGEDAKLHRVENLQAHERSRTMAAIPLGVLKSDPASILFLDEKGARYRLPRGGSDATPVAEAAFPVRVCREVCTERDMFHAGNTFYEVPAANAGGFPKIRPIATHPFHITDYCSWRGLLVLSGIKTDAPVGQHIVRSDDGQCALWLGAVDDLWKLGRPTGHGGPWKETPIKAGAPSDPYLADGFNEKTLTLSHDASSEITFKVEADYTGTGEWHSYTELKVGPGEIIKFDFPAAFPARWLRLISNADCQATAQLRYQ